MSAGRHEHVACPFCGLACDDLTVEVGEDGRVSMDSSVCQRAHQGFAEGRVTDEPMVDGRPVALNEAVAAVAERLKGAAMPLFGGMGCDIAGVRAVLMLAERLGASIDHAGGDGYAVNLHQLQQRGWFSASVAEVANRADVFVVFSVGQAGWPPRLFERCIWRRKAMFLNSPRKRDVVLVGENLDVQSINPPSVWAARSIDVSSEKLLDAVALLRMMWREQTIPPQLSDGFDLEMFSGLVKRLREASYGVIAWDAGSFAGPMASLMVESLCAWAHELNQKRRFVSFPLGGADNINAAAQVTVWQTGFPLRTSYGGGSLRHEPWLYATKRQWGRGARDDSASGWLERNNSRKMPSLGGGDVLVWVSAFDRNLKPPVADDGAPLIVIGRPGLRLESQPDIFIPVGAPGVDHDGVFVRLDGVVSMPLSGLRDSGLPSVAEVMTLIGQRIQ